MAAVGPAYPTWLMIPARDVRRATNFYTHVLKLHLRETDAPDQVQMFTFAGTPFEHILTGGIVRMPERITTHEPGYPSMFFTTANMEKSMALVEEAGGKMLTGREKVPTAGWSADFRDTEGNVHGLYTEEAEK